MPKRKRCRKDLDRIHSKILKAKEKLDNVGKNSKDRATRKQGQAKICRRLLPRSIAIGIYRNGAKGKVIQKEGSESTFRKARLKADALKLFNGDTSEFKYTKELSTHNENIEQSPNKNFVTNSLKFSTPDSILKQSPILGERQSKNQKLHFVKTKSEENFLKNLDFDKIKKQNVARKENIYEQKLFQNRKQSKATTITQTQLFNNDDFIEENRINKNTTQQISEDSKSISEALNNYEEVCKKVSAIHFGKFFKQNCKPDPLTTIITKLKHTYSNSLRQQYLRKRNKFKTMKLSELSVKNQACTYSDVSRVSPNSTSIIEYEVPKCSENRLISSFLLEDTPKEDDKIRFMQSDNIEPYDSISCSLQNILETNDTNDSIIENRKNNINQYLKQSTDIYQPTRAKRFYLEDEKNPVQKHFNYISHSSKNRRHNKDNFYIDFLHRFSNYENSQCIDNTKHARISTFSKDSMLVAKKHSSKDNTYKKLPIGLSNRIIDKCNAKNVKRSVTRYNNVTAIKNNHSLQNNDEDLFYKKSYVEKLYEQFGININDKNLDNEKSAYVDFFYQQFLREKNERELKTVKLPNPSVEHHACTYSDLLQLQMSPISTIFEINCKTPKCRRNRTVFPLTEDISQKNNKFHLMQNNIIPYDITKESYEMQFPNSSENVLTPNIINAQCANLHDRIKTFESQIGSLEIKDSQEPSSTREKFDINTHSNNLKERNRLCQFDNSLKTFETSYNTNAYIKRLTRKKEQVLPKAKKQLCLHNNHEINYLQNANFCNFNRKSTKPLFQQTKLHVCGSNNAKQEVLEKNLYNRNQNVLFNSINARTKSSTLNFSKIQTDKRFRESTREEMFSKADVGCAKNRANLNHCNEQYILLDPTGCQDECNVSQTHHFHKEAVQPQILHEDYNNSMANCINSSNNIPSLLLEQKHIAYTYPKVIDNQHCPVLLQNITQPIKYLAVSNNLNIQRIPIYINDKNVIEDVPLKVITLIKPNI